MMKAAASIDQNEIARFSALAAHWWDENGPMRPLHRLNPARLRYVRDRVCAHYGREAGARPLAGLSLLDIGCGAGVLCEPLARLGAKVTGLDASAEAIAAAKEHAALSGLTVDYACGSAEAFAGRNRRFDVVTALEIVEHAADMDSLLRAVAGLLRPGGIALFSTVNRTAKSFLLGIVAAEYVLKWVPKGTHDWRKFVRPSELAARLGAAGLAVDDITGMVFDPLNGEFRLVKGDAAVNYLLSARLR